MRPIFRLLDQSPPDGILQNVIPLLGEMRRVTDSRIEEIVLEPEPRRLGQIPFPIPHDIPHCDSRRKMDEHVQMIRHDQQKTQEPRPAVMLEPRGAKDRGRRIGEWRSRPNRRANGDEVERTRRNIRPRRRGVVHRFANRIGIHEADYTISAWS